MQFNYFFNTKKIKNKTFLFINNFQLLLILIFIIFTDNINCSLLININCNNEYVTFHNPLDSRNDAQIKKENISIASQEKIIDSINNNSQPLFDSLNQNPNFNNINNIIDTNIRYSDFEFKYANNQRYTITGNNPYYESQLKPLNIGLVTAGVGGLFVLQHIAQAQTIWKEKRSFKIIEDGSYAIYADKPGHIIGTYMASYSLSEALMASGLSWETSVVGGGLLGFAYNTYVEVQDGYGANFGFSPSDMYANAFGASFFIAQYYVPVLQNITPKFTYFPANWHGERQRQPHDFFIDDYSSHTLWFSLNIHNMLDEKYKSYWPEWLELSVGYAARNLTDPYCRNADGTPCFDLDKNFSYKGERVWGDPKLIFALDYNLTKILPEGGSFWNWARQTINYFKFPSPAIEVGIGGRTRFFLLYPFPLN